MVKELEVLSHTGNKLLKMLYCQSVTNPRSTFVSDWMKKTGGADWFRMVSPVTAIIIMSSSISIYEHTHMYSVEYISKITRTRSITPTPCNRFSCRQVQHPR